MILLASVIALACGQSAKSSKSSQRHSTPPELSDLVDNKKGPSAERAGCPNGAKARLVLTPKRTILRCEANGAPIGPVFFFHKSGSASAAGQYAKGKVRVGTWQYWNRQKELVKVEEFDGSGKLVERTTPRSP